MYSQATARWEDEEFSRMRSCGTVGGQFERSGQCGQTSNPYPITLAEIPTDDSLPLLQADQQSFAVTGTEVVDTLGGDSVVLARTNSRQVDENVLAGDGNAVIVMRLATLSEG